MSLPASPPATARPTPLLSSKERADKLDALFVQLKREAHPEAAKVIADQIRELWRQSGSATIDMTLQRAAEAMVAGRKEAALDFLDQAIVLNPNFAESWNIRATFHYTNGEPRRSMEDIQHTLALEPRHFGALAGMATILTEQGRDEGALRVWEQFLSVYPAFPDGQKQLETLTEKLAGARL